MALAKLAGLFKGLSVGGGAAPSSALAAARGSPASAFLRQAWSVIVFSSKILDTRFSLIVSPIH